MKLTSTILATAAASLAVFSVSTAPAVSAETTIRGASCFPIGSPPGRPFEAVVKKINAAGKGIINVKMIGGAPAIGSHLTLTQKMSKGAYDMVGCTESYFGNVMPESPVLRLSTKSYHELRQNGGIAYVEKLLNKKNIHYIARHWDYGPFHLFLSKPITKPDLKGLHLRVSPVYTSFFRSLGATTQSSSMPQIYTLMENGTVQGYGWPGSGWVPPWIKVTKFQVNPGFYASSLHTLINLKTWKKLSPQAQAVITKVGMEAEKSREPGSPGIMAGINKETSFRTGKGMKIIEFKGADRKKWLDAAYGAGWKEVLKRSPKHGAALMKLFK